MSLADKLASSVVKVEDFIGHAAQQRADRRASDIAVVSDGAITPTPEQLAALKAKAVEELEAAFAEQVASIANTFTLNTW